ncbi:hypothetical protein BRADI_2g37802v3 [Brachypodium distachyon]|uniref:Uncharacterized protein n=1 Tax=Brachypodium distachyon TaxID=15368 RepID=A0A2K2DCG4_BRADI|nr:hypothetical protein BRADI_2g37802v3 [Brachypodium distachyon]
MCYTSLSDQPITNHNVQITFLPRFSYIHQTPNCNRTLSEILEKTKYFIGSNSYSKRLNEKTTNHLPHDLSWP